MGIIESIDITPVCGAGDKRLSKVQQYKNTNGCLRTDYENWCMSEDVG